MKPDELRLYFPVKPFQIVQVYGASPEYYARFHDRFGNPETGHMGVDLRAAHGTPVYASIDGMAHFERDEHGGEGMVIRTAPRAYKGSMATFNVIHWHLIGDTEFKYPSPIPTDGKEYSVKIGDLIGYADNTGAPFESSGDHLHLGLVPFDMAGNAIEARNGKNGCIDPTTYFTGTYAVDYSTLIAKLTALVALLTAQLAALLKARSA